MKCLLSRVSATELCSIPSATESPISVTVGPDHVPASDRVTATPAIHAHSATATTANRAVTLTGLHNSGPGCRARPTLPRDAVCQHAQAAPLLEIGERNPEGAVMSVAWINKRHQSSANQLPSPARSSAVTSWPRTCSRAAGSHSRNHWGL